MGLLACGNNMLTAALGLSAAAGYVLVYTPLKKRSPVCTLVGAISGAIPPLMGWAAATGGIEYGACLLAAMLFLWQIPHFLALACLHRADMRRAGFRMLPLVDGTALHTCLFCLLYSLALVPLSLFLPFTQVTDWRSGTSAAAASAVLALLSLRLYWRRNDASARTLFRYSLAYLPLVLVLIVAGG